jgi:hypothetical protein
METSATEIQRLWRGRMGRDRYFWRLCVESVGEEDIHDVFEFHGGTVYRLFRSAKKELDSTGTLGSIERRTISLVWYGRELNGTPLEQKQMCLSIGLLEELEDPNWDGVV